MIECKFCGKSGRNIKLREYIVAIVHTVKKKYLPEEIKAFLCKRCVTIIKGEH